MNMIIDLRTGVNTVADGSLVQARAGKTGELITGIAHGNLFESASRKKIFFAANQTPATWTVGITTTYTGLVVSNPAGSNVNLSMLKASFALSAAPVAVAEIGLFGGFIAAGLVTHTTPVAPACTYLGGTTGSGLADAAATLPAGSVLLLPLMGGFTAATLPSVNPAVIDLDGSFIVPPGGWFGICALTAVVGFGGILWEEVSA